MLRVPPWLRSWICQPLSDFFWFSIVFPLINYGGDSIILQKKKLFLDSRPVVILVATTLKHPKPYKLQWLNECGEIRVKKQVLVSFLIDKYSDEVLCDLFLCMLDIYCWGDHGSLIGGQQRMVTPIDTHLWEIPKPSPLHHLLLSKCMKTSWIWKEKEKK